MEEIDGLVSEGLRTKLREEDAGEGVGAFCNRCRPRALQSLELKVEPLAGVFGGEVFEER